jgi:hypothetical protein
MSNIHIRVSGRGAAAIAAILVLAACTGSGGADRAPDGPTPGASASPLRSPSAASSAAAAADAASGQPAAAVVAPDTGVLPRTLSYGSLRWTVTDAVITNQDPKRYVAGTPAPPIDKTSLIVDFEIRNDSPHVFFVTTTSRLVVELPGGTEVQGKDLEGPSAAPESTVESRYAFEVPAPTAFDDIVLRFADPDREPSVDLPLSGSAPAVEADATAKVDRAVSIGLPGIDMQWTIDSVITGRDWPLPVGFKGGTRVAGARAERDHRWVGIVARVDVDRCDCKGGVLDQAGSTRLLVDGTPFTASAAESSKAIMNASTFSDVMLVFDIPTGASGAALQVGPLEQPEQQARIPLALE